MALRKQYLDVIDASMILNNLETVNDILNKARTMYGFSNIGLEYNTGCGGYDVFATVEETPEELNSRLISEITVVLLEGYQNSELEKVLSSLKEPK